MVRSNLAVSQRRQREFVGSLPTALSRPERRFPDKLKTAASRFRNDPLSQRSKVGMANRIVVPQFGSCPFQHDISGLENVTSVGQFQCLFDSLFGQQKAQALALELSERVKHISNQQGCESSACPIASICRSPPDNVLAGCRAFKARTGNN
jgi:hypothetical protein